MRVREFVVATSLVAGFVLVGSRAQAGGIVIPILNAAYQITSSNDPNTNTCFVSGVDNSFDASGKATGTGTGTDAVQVLYDTGRPTNTSRSSAKISVKQTSFATLRVIITGSGAGNDVNTVALPIDKCSVSGSVNASKMTGSVSASCSGSNIFGTLTANQVTSIQAAFNGNKTVTFKGNGTGKWSLKVKCSGTAVVGPI